MVSAAAPHWRCWMTVLAGQSLASSDDYAEEYDYMTPSLDPSKMNGQYTSATYYDGNGGRCWPNRWFCAFALRIGAAFCRAISRDELNVRDGPWWHVDTSSSIEQGEQRLDAWMM